MTLGPLILVSGPSGSGKSTLIRRVLEQPPFPLRLAVSATTRPARPGEVDGQQYHFWSLERFQRELAAGAFLEYAQVHQQHYYGTPRSEVDPFLQQGQGVILDIDVQGAAQVRKIYPQHLSIFVALSRWEMYEQRLRQRATETPDSIARRLQTARLELERQGEYDHVVLNDNLEQAVIQFREILTKYHSDRC